MSKFLFLAYFGFAASIYFCQGAVKTTKAKINCEFEDEKFSTAGCPFKFYVSELPEGPCALDREWCLSLVYDNVTVTSGDKTCKSSKRGSVGKCDSWGLCKRLMSRKSEQPQRGCFVKRDFSYKNPDSSRVFKVPELKIYCCKTGDRCNKVSRHGPMSCEPLSEPWPPAQA
uniref:Uncharacterized protein n=1 Tax=Romanomermis culicivorax TaxID=13658 RepID=A0A915L321_ROMCU